MITKLKSDEKLNKSKNAIEALDDLELLFKYCDLFEISQHVRGSSSVQFGNIVCLNIVLFFFSRWRST